MNRFISLPKCSPTSSDAVCRSICFSFISTVTTLFPLRRINEFKTVELNHSKLLTNGLWPAPYRTSKHPIKSRNPVSPRSRTRSTVKSRKTMLTFDQQTISVAAQYRLMKMGSSNTLSGRSMPRTYSNNPKHSRTALFSRRSKMKEARSRTSPRSRSFASVATHSM